MLVSKWLTIARHMALGAKSKIGHHCDGWNFFFQLSFLSGQKPRHFMYITWINNHCTPQKHQRGTAMTKHVTVATHLKVRRTEFCSKIPSVAKIHFWLSCFSYTEGHIKQPTYFSKKGEPQLTTLLWQRCDRKKMEQSIPSVHLQIVLLCNTLLWPCRFCLLWKH